MPENGNLNRLWTGEYFSIFGNAKASNLFSILSLLYFPSFESTENNSAKPLNCVTMYKHWLSDDWLLFFFLSWLSWKCASFLPPLQISAPSEFGVMGQQSETGPAVSLDYIKHTPDAAAGRQAGTVKLCLALSLSIIKKKTDQEWAVLHGWGW